MLAGITDTILSLHGWAALAVVFAIPALESSAFVGFVFPGEIAVLLGGVLAFEGRVGLVGAAAAAVLGAVVGDTVGYAVGRRWGDRILRSTIGRFVPDHHLERGKSYLARRGGRAVFLGRFTAALRVMIPGLAGMSGMRYRKFAAANIIGGAVWGSAFVLLGYAAGESWRTVEHAARKAGIVLAVVAVLIGITVLVARWISNHPDEVRAFRDRQRRRPWVDRLVTRYERQFSFLARRFRPEGALGLTLTLGLVGIVVFGSAFGRIARGVVDDDSLTQVDRRVFTWLRDHHEPFLTSTMKAVGQLGTAGVLVPGLVVLGVGWWAWRRTRRPLGLLAVTYLGSYVLSVAVREIVNRPGPPVDGVAVAGSVFPSGQVTQAFAVFGALAALVAASTPRWSRKVAAWTAALLLASAVGLSRLYMSAYWLTDVLGGFALGGLWLVLVLTVTRMVARPRPPGAGAGGDGGDVEAAAPDQQPEAAAEMACAPRR